MWNYENPDAYQEDVNHLDCPFGPVDFLAKHASRIWEQTTPKRLFGATPNAPAYYGFSGVLSAHITQIQPANWKDFEDKRLEGFGPLQLQLSQPSNVSDQQGSSRGLNSDDELSLIHI